MNTTKINVTESYAASLEYHLLPQDAGQAVDYRYAVGEVGGGYGVFCRRCDADGGVSYSYQSVRDDNTVDFEPQNGRLPRVMEEMYRIGEVETDEVE